MIHFYYIIANYNFLEDGMLVVIVLLGVFLHSALGGNVIQVPQIGKSTDRFLLILCGFYSLKLPHHDLIEHICHIVVLTLSSGEEVVFFIEVELFNAEQSTTHCYSGTCFNASNAIDGYWNTSSYTVRATGNWWQVSMSNTLVDQIVLKAATYPVGEEITVSLYSGEKLAGQCKSHSGDYATETLSCDRVTADRVRLTLSSTAGWARLIVNEITVSVASNYTIGI